MDLVIFAWKDSTSGFRGPQEAGIGGAVFAAGPALAPCPQRQRIGPVAPGSRP